MTTARRLVGWGIVGLGIFIGCDRPAQPTPPVAPAPPPTAAVAHPDTTEPTVPPATAWPREVVDGYGRRVQIARPPLRIVALAPSNTEIVFAVGAQDRLVGRTTFCTYPPEALKVAAVGGMTPRTINLEAVVALRPDLILATCGVQEPLLAPLERLNLPVIGLDADDFAGVARNVRLVGSLTDHAAEGERLATQFLDRVEAVRQRVAARTTPRPRVLYLVSEDPLMSAGPQTFIGKMVETAGGTNIFGDVTARYPRPSEEEILARDPQVILGGVGPMNAGTGDDAAHRARIAHRPGWSQISAARDGRIHFLVEDQILRPSLRLVDGLEAVARALEAPGVPAN